MSFLEKVYLLVKILKLEFFKYWTSFMEIENSNTTSHSYVTPYDSPLDEGMIIKDIFLE